MSGYISEIRYADNHVRDFIEVAAPTGTDTTGWSVAFYNQEGTLNTAFDLGGVVSTTAGKDVYVIDNNTSGFENLGATKGYALVDGTGTVVQFISFSSTITAVDGPAAGLTATQYGDLTDAGSGASMETTDRGATYSAQYAPNPGTISCYAPGTWIDTPYGPRAVETLAPGDLVLTCDHRPQPIRWTCSGDHPLEGVENEAKPVQIKAGALGRGLPSQDLIVSPQHRIFVGGAGQLDAIFTSEAFVPAKSLTALPGIRHMNDRKKIVWIHFACDRHEVITANGCLSESLLLGPMVVNGLNATERHAAIDIFGPAPSPGAALNGSPARACLTVGAAKRRIAGYFKENGAPIAKEIRKWDRDLAMEEYEAERMREAREWDQTGEKAFRVA